MILSSAYQAALDYIFNYVDYERRRTVPYTETAWNLERTRRVLAALGDPHLSLRFVHVAGSKGKGSTAANIEAVLRASGRRVGFYTSPHLHTFRERIRVDGELISQDDVVHLLAECRSAIEAVPGITTFEIITVLALLHFARQGMEWVVLEVGLGGRLDATNVVTPEVCVITPISLEHTALLGDTLAAIAREKAGIIKPGVPVVTAPQYAEALAVITEVAAQQHAPLVQVGAMWTWHCQSDRLAGQRFAVQSPLNPWGTDPLTTLSTPLLGAHQLANATTAVAACALLAERGVPISALSLRRGLAQVIWPARLEVLAAQPGAPRVVLDSAHNDSSAGLLRAALTRYFSDRPWVWVIGVSNDKDAGGILHALLPGAAAVYLTRARHPRAADPNSLLPLAAAAQPAGLIHVSSSVAEALTRALAEAPAGAVVCVAGSLFVAGEAREAWLARYPHALPTGDWAFQAEMPQPDWQVSHTEVAR
ncbi:MAG: folylpolyglutamate synthase/dihydrofolate synthase family protein [Caldilineales bacterium]